jgi:mono/diheme cytochrome c family protein
MNKTAIATTLGAGLMVLAFGAASADEKKTITYANTIKKIMDDRCLACHGPDSPTIEEFDKDKAGFKKKLKGPRMDTYENLMVFVNGSDAGALMRRLDDGKNTKDGKPGNMYVNLADDDHERAERFAKFKKWVGSWNLKKRAELTEAELKAIKAPRKCPRADPRVAERGPPNSSTVDGQDG